MDLSKLKLAEMKDLQARVGVELKNREKSDIEKARNDIKAIAKSLGLSLKDLTGDGKAKAKVRKMSDKVATQYPHPRDTSQEWAGRGRQPKWVKELLAAGKNLMSAKISG